MKIKATCWVSGISVDNSCDVYLTESDIHDAVIKKINERYDLDVCKVEVLDLRVN